MPLIRRAPPYLMAVRGQRFHLDLHSNHEPAGAEPLPAEDPHHLNMSFIRDITERPADATTKAPSPPSLKNSATGFPVHRKRPSPSKFKRQRPADATARDPDVSNRTAQNHETPSAPARQPSGKAAEARQEGVSDGAERAGIHEENQRRLAHMSPAEIEQEREMLVSGLSSSLIERLLKRANIDEGRTDAGTDPPFRGGEEFASVDAAGEKAERISAAKEVSHEPAEALGHGGQQTRATPAPDPDSPPSEVPKDLQPASARFPLPLLPNIHFPQPPETPSLDPSDPDFLEKLHSKYFPHLPVDPSQLAWMAPIPAEGSAADRDSPYNPTQESLPLSSLRFDFRGRLIPPRLARQIPVSKGLHHHGLAPEAAGYTLPELAHLSRSTVAAQRCIAYQTLGRILYRLGRGDFGADGDELYLGMWKCLEEGRVIDTLLAEAGMDDGKGSRSCKVTATEAIWLWHKGGGKRLKAE